MPIRLPILYAHSTCGDNAALSLRHNVSAHTVRRAYATTNILFLIHPSLLRSSVCTEINPLARRQPLELPLQSSVNPQGAALARRKGYWSWQSPTTDWWRTVPTTVSRKTRQYLFTFTFPHFFCLFACDNLI